MPPQTLKRSKSTSPPPPQSNPTKRSRPALTKPTRFLILSDTHDAKLPSHPECDVLLHCGDLTEDGSPSSLAAAIKALGNIAAELKLAIPGNHDITLDKEYYLSEGGLEADHLTSRSLISGPESLATQNGVTFLDEGAHRFTLRSGARFALYASQWTPRHGSSAFQYPSGEDRYNPPDVTPKWATNVATETSIIPDGIDIVMTHGPPKYILDTTSAGQSAGCEHLRRAIACTKPRLHCFGHIHSGYGAQRVEFTDAVQEEICGDADSIVMLPKEFVGRNQARRKGYASLPPSAAEAFRVKRQSLMVNAAIVDEEGEPWNMPWVVELDLPVIEQSEEENGAAF